MWKRIFILLTVFILTICCFADEPRTRTKFESKNGNSSIIYRNGKWILGDVTSLEKYKIDDEGFKSMTIFVSNNGQNIVVIDDFMEGHKIGNRNTIWFYNNGKLVKSYRMNELVSDTCNISKSIWHNEWCLENFDIIDNESHFTLSTYEMTDFIFDLTTGEVITKKKPDGFDSESLIVFGEFRKGKEEQVTMKIKRYISGKVQQENILNFKTTHYGAGLWHEVLVIKNGVDITPDKYRCKIYLNTCDNEK